ncbi:hypothetical protein WM457_03022 (plasmid) [Clavibacter nebraskensis]
MTWAPQREDAPYEHTITRVDLYSHAVAVPERAWLASAPTVAKALALCNGLHEPQPRPPGATYDWERHTVERGTERP